MIEVQKRWKAVAGLIGGFLSPLVSFYMVNQNLTLKEVLISLVTGLLTGGAVHQIPNKQ